MEHSCLQCGKAQSKKKYWKYIIDQDVKISHATQFQKKMLLELIMLAYNKPLPIN